MLCFFLMMTVFVQDGPPGEVPEEKIFTAFDFPENAPVETCELSDIQGKNVKLTLSGVYAGEERAALEFEIVVSHRNFALGKLAIHQLLDPQTKRWERTVWVKLTQVQQPLRFEANFQRLGEGK